MRARKQTVNTKPATFTVWLSAARPKTLWAAVAPVAMACAMAWRDGAFHPVAAGCALAAAMLLQIATNFCNDYADFAKGTDTAERTGPLRATAAGWVTPEAMKRATVLTFGLAALAAAYLVVRGGWVLALLMALSIASGALYTAGPKPLGYLGLGDIFVFVFFGPVAVAGTYYVQALQFSTVAAVAGIAPGLLSVAILVVNNLRDVEGDARTGKRTLAVRFGRTFARVEYTFCILAAGLIPFILVGHFHAPPNVAAAGLVVLAAISALRTIWTSENSEVLNSLLAYTALLLLLFAGLFSVGWVL